MYVNTSTDASGLLKNLAGRSNEGNAMIEITATHNAIVALLRQMDGLTIKDFKQSRLLAEAYARITSGWGYDINDNEKLNELDPNAEVSFPVEDHVAQFIKETIELIMNTGTVTGFGARLLLQVYDAVNED